MHLHTYGKETGKVKRQTWVAILTRQKLVQSAEVYAEVANQSCPNIDVIHVSKEEVQGMKGMLDEKVFNGCLTLPGTRKSHWFEVTGDS